MAAVNFYIGSPKTLVFELRNSDGDIIPPESIQLRICSSTTKRYFIGEYQPDFEVEEGESAYRWDTSEMTVGSLILEVILLGDTEQENVIVERVVDFGYATESSVDGTYSNGNA